MNLCYLLICCTLLLGCTCCAAEHEQISWDYFSDASTDCKVGDNIETTTSCGPSYWGKVSEFCSMDGQESPVNIPIHPDHSDVAFVLDELRWNVGECLLATVQVTQSAWKVIFDASCKQVFSITRFGHTYYARYMEFHAPSEHTLDNVRYEMEVQIVHTTSNNKRNLVVAVLLQSMLDAPDNPFLAPIWAIAANSPSTMNTTHSFLPTALNFVDNFLPSLGLSFNYYVYEGRFTTPSCNGALWIVMRQPALISQAQVTSFLNSMQNIPNTHARPDGSNNRLIQDIGLRTIGFYQDADCFLRYCHNIFDLGEHFDLAVCGAFLCILVFFTLFFEMISGLAEKQLGSKRTARDLLAKVHKELSVLGLVSFVAFTINSTCSVGTAKTWFVMFEFVHILIFFVAIVYVMFSAVLLSLTTAASKDWDKILVMDGIDVLKFVESHQSIFRPTTWPLLGRPGTVFSLGIFHCRFIFIQRNQLPGDFDFLKYIKYYLSRNIKSQLDISPIVWVTVTILVGCWGALFYYGGIRVVYGPLGWFNAMAVLATWVLCFKSFVRLLEFLGLPSLDALKLQITKHPRRANQVYYSKAMVQAHKKLVGASFPLLEKFISPRPIAFESRGKSRSDRLLERGSLKELSKQRRELQQLQSCWVPLGSSLVIRTSSNITLLAMCFYTAFYVLNVRAYLDPLQHVLVISSVIIVLCVFMPMVLLAITIVEAIVQPDSNLINEVMEHTEELHVIRRRLVDALFPDMDECLFEDVSVEEVKEVFSYFGKVGDAFIEKEEFLEKCQLLGLRLSESKARHFLELLDLDRDGVIDGRELFNVIFHERISRIDSRLVTTFGEVCSHLSADSVTIDHLPNVLELVFSDMPPDPFVKSVIADVVDEQQHNPTINLFDLRRTIVKHLAARRLDITQAMLQEIESSKPRSPYMTGAFWKAPNATRRDSNNDNFNHHHHNINSTFTFNKFNHKHQNHHTHHTHHNGNSSQSTNAQQKHFSVMRLLLSPFVVDVPEPPPTYTHSAKKISFVQNADHSNNRATESVAQVELSDRVQLDDSRRFHAAHHMTIVEGDSDGQVASRPESGADDQSLVITATATASATTLLIGRGEDIVDR